MVVERIVTRRKVVVLAKEETASEESTGCQSLQGSPSQVLTLSSSCSTMPS